MLVVVGVAVAVVVGLAGDGLQERHGGELGRGAGDGAVLELLELGREGDVDVDLLAAGVLQDDDGAAGAFDLRRVGEDGAGGGEDLDGQLAPVVGRLDRKSTRLNSSHEWISRMPSSA